MPREGVRGQRSGVRMHVQRFLLCGLLACATSPAFAQAPPDLQKAAPDLQQVLQRMDRLEEQNRAMMAEIRALRQELAAGKPAAPEAPTAEAAAANGEPAGTIPERVEVQEHRTAQLDQEKVSSDHRLPVTLTGMLLMNSFWTGKGGAGDNPTIAPPTPGSASGGATFRQSVLGLKLDGPTIVGGAKVTGSVYADFAGGSGVALNQTVRLRVASVDAAWKNTTLTFALDKPILAPREPDSLAQVAVSPLTSAGNLWLWQPQARVEQRFAFGHSAGLRAQLGLYETAEGGAGVPTEYTTTLGKNRPGYEGRFEFWGSSGEDRRIEVAPGFHVSTTRVAGQSVPSQIFSVDWLIRPVARVDVTGQFFYGENTGVIGGLRQGVNVLSNGVAIPVHSVGGWAQLKVRITSRASFNFYGGQEDPRNRDLILGQISKNQAYAGNIMYRFGSNILGSIESSMVRTSYFSSGTRIFPHYDLAIAYLF
jgi:hypothetical protein